MKVTVDTVMLSCATLLLILYCVVTTSPLPLISFWLGYAMGKVIKEGRRS